jgi:hypothetical protein
MILDALPDQLNLPFYLWTRAAVAKLIEREYAVVVWSLRPADEDRCEGAWLASLPHAIRAVRPATDVV